MVNSIIISLVGFLSIATIQADTKECFDIKDLQYFDLSVLDCLDQLYSAYTKNQRPSFNKELGEGSFGKVYECKPKNNKYKNIPQVILKEISYKSTNDEEQNIKYIEDEVHTSHLLNRLQNIHAVTFYGCIRDSKQKSFYLFYERMSDDLHLGSGENCKNKSSIKCKFYNSTAVEQLIVVLDILEGAKRMHDQNMYHLDIKPENIMLIDNPLMAKLSDFGLSYQVNKSTQIIQTDRNESSTTAAFGTNLKGITVTENYSYNEWCYRGSPYYIDPKFVLSTKQPSDKFDVYSLGITLIKILCAPNYIYKPKFNAMKPILDKDYFNKRYEVFESSLNNFKKCVFLSKISQNEKVRKNFETTLLSMIKFNQKDRPKLTKVIQSFNKMLKDLNKGYKPLELYKARIAQYYDHHIKKFDFRLFVKINKQRRLMPRLYGSPDLDNYISNFSLFRKQSIMSLFDPLDYKKKKINAQRPLGYFESILFYIYRLLGRNSNPRVIPIVL